jgi:hypothetical protein
MDRLTAFLVEHLETAWQKAFPGREACARNEVQRAWPSAVPQSQSSLSSIVPFPLVSGRSNFQT